MLCEGLGDVNCSTGSRWRGVFSVALCGSTPCWAEQQPWGGQGKDEGTCYAQNQRLSSAVTSYPGLQHPDYLLFATVEKNPGVRFLSKLRDKTGHGRPGYEVSLQYLRTALPEVSPRSRREWLLRDSSPWI